MGDGVNITGGIRNQAPIQDTNTVDEAKPKEVKQETPSNTSVPESPRAKDSSTRKWEQQYGGSKVKADLEQRLSDRPALNSESMKAADKILTNPKLSNEAKIAELQKMIGKAGKAEFQQFMKDYSGFPENEKQLINSAIGESESIMGRVATELPQDEQLKIVQDTVMNPLKGKTPKEEEKRLARADKGTMGWIRHTDTDTLDKALGGRSIDFRASAKLYGSMVTEYPRIVVMSESGKLMGDKMQIATEVMNASIHPQHPASRADQEALAASLIAQNVAEEERRRERTRELK